VVQVLGDAELDPPLPHPRLGALLGRGADQRRLWMALLEVLEDRDRLRNDPAVVELEGGELPARIALGVGRPAVLAGEEIDGDARDRDALLGEEHTERARVRTE